MVGTPGLYTDEHVAAWKVITDKVHSKGGKIVTQLWALGRTQDGKSGIPVVSASNIPMAEGKPVPKALTKEEIQEYVKDYADSAKKAMDAGFDGIEVHGARECRSEEEGIGGADLQTDIWSTNSSHLPVTTVRTSMADLSRTEPDSALRSSTPAQKPSVLEESGSAYPLSPTLRV